MLNPSVDDIENVINGRIAAPLNIRLMPSNICATDCIYCYAERKNISKQVHLTTNRWLEIIDECVDLGIELAVFSEGDPLTYPGIMEILKKNG